MMPFLTLVSNLHLDIAFSFFIAKIKIYIKLPNPKNQLSDPCIYSVEELQERLIEVERDFAEGKGIASEELRKKYAGV